MQLRSELLSMGFSHFLVVAPNDWACDQVRLRACVWVGGCAEQQLLLCRVRVVVGAHSRTVCGRHAVCVEPATSGL